MQNTIRFRDDTLSFRMELSSVDRYNARFRYSISLFCLPRCQTDRRSHRHCVLPTCFFFSQSSHLFAGRT